MNFVAELLANINTQVDQYTFEGYHAIVSNLSTTFTLLLVIYFAGLGWLVIRGHIPLTPMALAWHMLKAAVIFAFALSWDYFSFFFVNLFLNGTDKLAGILLSTQAQTTDTLTLTNILGEVWVKGNNIFTGIWRTSGADFLLGTLMGLIGYLAINGLTAVALFYIIMSKIALSVLLVLAPVFLPMYLWQATRGIFVGWLQLLVQWMMTPLFLYIFLGLFMPLIQNQINTMSNPSANPTTASISIFALLAVIAMAIFKQSGTMSKHIAKRIEIDASVGSSETVPGMVFRSIRQVRN